MRQLKKIKNETKEIIKPNFYYFKYNFVVNKLRKVENFKYSIESK